MRCVVGVVTIMPVVISFARAMVMRRQERVKFDSALSPSVLFLFFISLFICFVRPPLFFVLYLCVCVCVDGCIIVIYY
jgi:uncharacterized membrane protein HdeD (DUF308 family)